MHFGFVFAYDSYAGLNCAAICKNVEPILASVLLFKKNRLIIVKLTDKCYKNLITVEVPLILVGNLNELLTVYRYLFAFVLKLLVEVYLGKRID